MKYSVPTPVQDLCRKPSPKLRKLRLGHIHWHHLHWICHMHRWCPGPWFNIKMSSYQYRKSRFGDKTVVGSSYLHNEISYAVKMPFYIESAPCPSPPSQIYRACATLTIHTLENGGTPYTLPKSKVSPRTGQDPDLMLDWIRLNFFNDDISPPRHFNRPSQVGFSQNHNSSCSINELSICGD